MKKNKEEQKSEFYLFEKDTQALTKLKSPDEICQSVEHLIPEKRIETITKFLQNKGNEWIHLRNRKKIQSNIEKNMSVFSMPMIMLYLPQFYHRIFLKLCLLSSPKNGLCKLNTTEFFWILSEWDQTRFVEVFTFLIKSKIIQVKNHRIIILKPYRFGVYGFDLKALKLLEETFNRFQIRTFKAKTNYTFLTDFEKI